MAVQKVVLKNKNDDYLFPYTDSFKNVVETMGTASILNLGVTVLYLGETDSNYIKGHIYTCSYLNGGYSWVDVTPSGAEKSYHTLMNFDVDSSYCSLVKVTASKPSLMGDAQIYIQDGQLYQINYPDPIATNLEGTFEYFACEQVSAGYFLIIVDGKLYKFTGDVSGVWQFENLDSNSIGWTKVSTCASSTRFHAIQDGKLYYLQTSTWSKTQIGTFEDWVDLDYQIAVRSAEKWVYNLSGSSSSRIGTWTGVNSITKNYFIYNNDVYYSASGTSSTKIGNSTIHGNFIKVCYGYALSESGYLFTLSTSSVVNRNINNVHDLLGIYYYRYTSNAFYNEKFILPSLEQTSFFRPQKVITSASAVTFGSPISFTQAPQKGTKIKFRCVAANNGYAAGDEIEGVCTANYRQPILYWSGNTAYVLLLTAIYGLNKTTCAAVTLTASNWNVFLEGYA